MPGVDGELYGVAGDQMAIMGHNPYEAVVQAGTGSFDRGDEEHHAEGPEPQDGGERRLWHLRRVVGPQGTESQGNIRVF